MPAVDAAGAGDLVGAAGDAEFGCAGGGSEDLDVGPGDAVGQAGAEGLHGGLFGGEARGEVLEATAVVGLGGGALVVREASLEEAVAVLGEHLLDSGGFDQIDAVSDDGHGEQ